MDHNLMEVRTEAFNHDNWWLLLATIACALIAIFMWIACSHNKVTEDTAGWVSMISVIGFILFISMFAESFTGEARELRRDLNAVGIWQVEFPDSSRELERFVGEYEGDKRECVLTPTEDPTIYNLACQKAVD